MGKCGIYIIKNKVNNFVYVGQSVDIMCRWYAHKDSAKNEKRQDHYTQIHQAMSLLGVENFYLEVLEYCEYSSLDEREIYWIAYYNSYKNGYNMTPGGNSYREEANGRAVLTKEQVEEIRMAYGNKICFKDVYEKYKGVISKRGLQKVWHFETWKHIYPEVYTDENRLWHKTQAKKHQRGNVELGLNNKQRACTEEEIIKMRELRAAGLPYRKIGEIMARSQSVVQKYCKFQECKKPNRIGKSIIVKNIETGLVFDSLTEAAKWAGCDRHALSNCRDTTSTAGVVPTTNEPAHWITL